VIWTGSDDGLVHITRDGGATWTNVTPPGLAECLINAIEVSPHDKAVAYVATTRYKFNDHNPALYKTTDYGKTWTNISKGIPQGAFTRVVREDDQRKDLLFAGTEQGVFLSWNGGKDWHPFQLNLPITPITDLRVHLNNLIASTSGRSFWILDDLNVLRQFNNEPTALTLFKPQNAVLANGSSELDSSDTEFDGTNPYHGVNPANGVVFYYHLPELKKDERITLEILDADGKLIHSFTSVKDSLFKKYDGGPPAEPVLAKAKGLNRFVWNMRYPTLPGIPFAYIEGSYRGHKAIPGKYSANLKWGDRIGKTEFEILPNPLYSIDAATYNEYHKLMSSMEASLSEMHQLVNSVYAKQLQLAELLHSLPSDSKFDAFKKQGNELVQKMKSWDEDMVQRKAKAYDDVDNFDNKFTANFMFLINHTESDIPRVNKPSLDRLSELSDEWSGLKKRAEEILNADIPSLNKAAWELGLGAIWKK
jgi:hypothetical protein